MQHPPQFLTALAVALAIAQGSAWVGAGELQGLAVYEVRASRDALLGSVDAQVEAVREAVLAAQVQGSVVGLTVRVGDRVSTGQELVRIDARAAQQAATASAAQVDAARAAQQVAQKEWDRQKQLFQMQYISQAALDRAEAQWKAAQSQMQAQQALAAAASTQSGFYSIKAPFAGIVSAVPVSLGDMALPGKPLVSLYDPAALRVTANVGAGQVNALRSGQNVQLELGSPALRQPVAPEHIQILPVVDAQSHTLQVRIALQAAAAHVVPGSFARLWIPTAPAGDAQPGALVVPVAAVVQRAEMQGVYVLDAQNRPLLRQVRLGRAQSGMVEVLSGVKAGDRVATQPQAAAKVR